jgi:hypothetical protein
MLSTQDNIASLGSFVVEMAIVAAAMRVAWQHSPTEEPTWHASTQPGHTAST